MAAMNLKPWTLRLEGLSLDLHGPSVAVVRLRSSQSVGAMHFRFAKNADHGHQEDKAQDREANGSPDEVAAIRHSQRHNVSLGSAECQRELLGTAFEGWVHSTVLVGGILLLLTDAGVPKEAV